MRTRVLSHALVIATGWIALAASQEPAFTHLPQVGEPPAALAGSAFLEIPLHRACEGTGEERFFALRSSYKAALGIDGFELVPDRGPLAERNLPFAWTTTALRRGSAVHLPGAAPTLSAEGWRAELAHPAWVERWELRPEGLAQSWTLERPLAGEGDLVLEGHLRTELSAPLRAAEHAALCFSDEEGNTVLSYGEAMAFDARGRSIEVATSWDGESIRLIVDGAWLDAATYPVLVDPLSAPVAFGPSSSSRPLGSISVAVENESANGSLLVGFTRIWSATDHDVYAFTCDLAFQNPVLVYSDLTTARSDMDADATYVPGADRWLISHRSDGTDPVFGATSSLRVAFVDRGAATNNTGVVQVLASPSFVEAYTEPALGAGGDSGANLRAPLAFRADVTSTRSNTLHSEVRVAWIDASTRTLGAPTTVSATGVGTRYDREKPAVTRTGTASSNHWVVAWQELDRGVPSDDWDIRGALFDNQGARRSEAELADGGGTRHATQPRIDGLHYQFCLSWAASNSFALANAASIRSRTFSWTNSAGAVPTFHAPARTVRGPLLSGEAWSLGDLSIDMDTLSHWCLGILEPVADRTLGTRQVSKILRLGGTGAPTEAETFVDLPGEHAIPPTTLFLDRDFSFVAIGGSATAGGYLQGALLSYPAEHGHSSLGGSCGPFGYTVARPLAGHRGFYMGAYGWTTGLQGFLLLSLAPASIPLDGVGLPGCLLKVDPGSNFVASIGFQTVTVGNGLVRLPLPDEQVFRGNFYAQILMLTPNDPTNTLRVSPGIEVRVR